MFEKIKFYLINKRLKYLINKATKCIYSDILDLNLLTSKLIDTNDNLDLLAAYFAINIAAVPGLELTSDDLTKATHEFILLKNNKKKDIDFIIEGQKLRAEVNLLKMKIYFELSSASYQLDKYSFDGMKYTIEKIKKGPLTFHEYGKFKIISKDLSTAKIELETYLRKKY